MFVSDISKQIEQNLTYRKCIWKNRRHTCTPNYSLCLSAALFSKQKCNVVTEPKLQNFWKLFSSMNYMERTDNWQLEFCHSGQMLCERWLPGGESCRAAKYINNPPAAEPQLVLSSSWNLSFAYIILLKQYYEFYSTVAAKIKLFSDLFFPYLYMFLYFSLNQVFAALIQSYPEIK